MGIGGSLFLIAVGAVLKWAVTERVSGVDVQTVGTILMIVGAIGFLATMLLWGTRRRTDVIRERDASGGSRVTYLEPGAGPRV